MFNTLLSVHVFFALAINMALAGCVNHQDDSPAIPADDIAVTIPHIDTEAHQLPEIINEIIAIQITTPDSIITFARTLIGVPYLYASIDPAKGFDCSGFITYVFNHFNVKVPRSSVDFTNYGKEITTDQARPGDLILFTGTDSTIRTVGHMGIVENIQDGKLHFIHSTSGKGKGVVITPFEKYYQRRFVKVIRVFPDELFE